MTEPTPELIAAAQATQAKWQIPASLSLSACGVESAFFTKMPKNSLNGFGIKALPGQPQVDARTGEQTISGAIYTITAGFRVFASIADAFDAYGRLLGLGKPYRDMVTKFLASPRAPADVQALSNSLTGVYASARNYGSALIAVQKQFNLYQYDKETPVADTTAVTATSTPATPTSPPRITPPVGGQIRVPWGSAAAQFVAHEKIILTKAGVAVVEGGLKMLPYGSIISMFVGPTLIEQYIGQAFTALESELNTQSFSVSDSNRLAAAAASLVNKNEAWLIDFLEGNLDPMIAEAISAMGFPAPASA